MNNQKIIVVGSSYSSAQAYFYLQELITKAREPFALVWITDKNYYTFNSYLPQSLSDDVGINDLSQELRSVGIIRPGVSYLETKVQNIDFENKKIKTQKGEIAYKYLVLAPENDRYNSDETRLLEESITVNNFLDVVKLKSHIIKKLEPLFWFTDMKRRGRNINKKT